GQLTSATVVVPGQLNSVEQFGNIVLRANTDGSAVRLRDVARIELGAQTYSTSARLNGKSAVGMGVQLSPSGNALAAAEAVRKKLDELQRFYPQGVTSTIPYDSSRFVNISITEVVKTLFEAVALVFVVMFLFLQNWRYTIIPTIVVPIALLGTFGALLALGFSINVLTMFGMVLVIGIVVDDAIVVVENVERIMSEEGLEPRPATRKAMGQISGAIVGVTVVLISVFVPLAFFAGSTGNIYRQFSAVMVVSIAFSAFMALSLTPALCATLLKPVDDDHHEKKGFFGWFNRSFSRTAKGYESVVSRILRRAVRYLIIYAAIRAQNAQVSSGSIGDLPNITGQGVAATEIVSGQLGSVEQFQNIVLRANTDGSTVRLKDVARVELNAQTFATSARLNGKPSTGIGVQLSPTGNALATADAIRKRMGELAPYFPAGMKWEIPYDSSRFVRISISQVVETLLEAVALVFLVMFLFLQNWRYTIIPTLVVPVALLGTFATLLALGFSINVLTMFGMVLVIGIVVDDAIVVVENVERIMSEEGLPPREATRKAMGQISGAIVGVTVVLISVFVPLAFFAGSTGNISRQFSAVMVASIAFSAFMALSLTPALCATLLKPVEKGHHVEKRGFFGWFNRSFRRTAHGYEGFVSRMLRRAPW
ncbi:MAG TPA: efflux RND transporter permease subunit, partial [Ramlibacter sp.]